MAWLQEGAVLLLYACFMKAESWITKGLLTLSKM